MFHVRDYSLGHCHYSRRALVAWVACSPYWRRIHSSPAHCGSHCPVVQPLYRQTQSERLDESSPSLPLSAWMCLSESGAHEDNLGGVDRPIHQLPIEKCQTNRPSYVLLISDAIPRVHNSKPLSEHTSPTSFLT